MGIKTNIYILSILGILFLGLIPKNVNAATSYVCKGQLDDELENHPEWIGVRWVSNIESTAPSECLPSNKRYWVSDSGSFYCITNENSSAHADLPVPATRVIRSREYTQTGYCGGDRVYNIGAYPSGDTGDICLLEGAKQVIKSPWIIGESVLSDEICNPSPPAYTYAVKVKLRIAADNRKYCILNGSYDPGFASVPIPKGFFLDEVDPAQDGCKFSDTPSFYGKQVTLIAVAQQSSQTTCAATYDYIPSGYVATAVLSNSNCGWGKQWTATRVTNQNSITDVCQVGGTLYNPDGYVIKNKLPSGCAVNNISNGTYTLSKVSGTSDIENVCPETKMPTGWYKSSGGNTGCNWTLSLITGTTISNACIAGPKAVSDGWYIDDTREQGSCPSGQREVTLKIIDGTSEYVEWIDNTAVPAGYVVKPGTSSCASNRKCYFISLPEDISGSGLTGNPKVICKGSYEIPSGWELGDEVTTGTGCPVGFTRWQLFADIPAPPPNQSSNPQAFITTETPVSGKPAGMPDLDF